MGAMLNEESIAGLLAVTVSHLETGNLEQAEVALHTLDFGQLLRPIRSNTKPPQTIEPAAQFGRARVHETGGHIHSCLSALKTGNRELALEAARAAVERWATRL